MFSGKMKHWLVLAAIAALAALVIACGTDETKTISNDGVGGVGAQPNDTVSTDNTGDRDGDGLVDAGIDIPPADLGYEVVEVLAPIESVQILVMESYPEQYLVQIISGLPSGCATFSRADVARDGTTISISVYNNVPAPDQLIACTAIYGLHDENINLGSDFERGVEYTVMVNDHPAGYFNSGVAGSLPVENDSDFVVEPAPVEGLEIIIGEDSRGPTTYYAHVVWGLKNGCVESLEPNLVQTSRAVFDIYPLAKVPSGDVACTDDYRIDSAQVELGVVGEGLVSCAVYTVKYGDETVEFQAIAPNVRCADPDEATPTPAPPTGGGSIISDQQALEFSLEGNGADVEYGGQVKFNEFFGLYPTELKVNGQQVLIYEFAPGASAEKASETVSADGSTFESSDGMVMSVMWVAPPHFYLFGNSIVLYIGNDAEMGALLDSVAGKFAGSNFDEVADGADAEYVIRFAVIEQVTLASTRSIPAQQMISMTIALGGSCETFDEITWEVDGREVLIDVTTKSLTGPVACTLAIIYEDQSINIGSDFETDVEYTVVVNGEAQGTFIGG